MISEFDLNRVKELIKSEDELDTKIGIGLAFEKGMSIEELAEHAYTEWINEKAGSIKEFALQNKNMIIKGLIKNINSVFNTN